MAFLKNKSKKGQLIDLITVLIIIFGAALTLLLVKFVTYEVDKELTTSGTHTVESAQVMQEMGAHYEKIDGGMIFVVLGLTASLILTSFLIKAHPAFMIINIIGIFFLVFLGAVLSNFYTEVAITDGVNVSKVAYGGSLQFTDYIMLYLPYICAVITAISTIVMFAKGREAG